MAMRNLLNLLIVEDDQNLAASLRLLIPETFKVYVTQKSSLLPDHVFFHAALVDMHIESTPEKGADGPGVIEKLVKKNPQIEVVAMSGDLDRALMEKAIFAGASRFLAKPLSEEEVKAVVSKIEAYWNLRLASYEQGLKNRQLVGQSLQIENLRKKIAQLKAEKAPILIEGETGVGKDVVAELLNQQEGQRPFVPVNCSALSENLFESEFFGHIKGSFTGADQNKIGFAEAAHGGDLFLDEIEALPLSQQAKLLRFLESGEIRKVGAKEPQHVEVRVIAASNIPLKQLILEKKFREDLFYRLSAHILEIPPLRKRPEDIKALAEHFVENEKPRRNKSFDSTALDALQKYSWPGNVRELKRICEQLVLTSPLPIIRSEDFSNLFLKTYQQGSTETMSLQQNLDEFLKQQEKRFIEFCLKQTEDLDAACDVLKISKSNLYKKIKELDISYE
jgi:DNA-binding NtrC family response regulator